MFPDGINPQAPTFFRTLAASPPLPRTLKHLALSWEFQYSEFDDAPICGRVPDLAAFRDALLAHCPALTFLWLGGHDFLLWWSQRPDGTIDEVTAEDADEVTTMFRELITSWENLS
ncbi:hypothetical protein DFH09DRAFT_1341117 [Mycena vulgaris]|nr:hypothetical protein DFH09DRAFT_1341117 [Mycena vulgaris]